MKRIYTLAFLGLALCIATSPVLAQGIFDKTADWDLNDGSKVAGSATFSGGVYTVKGNGNDIWGNADEGFFLYTEKSGSWSLSGKVEWIAPGGNEWAKIGVMIREKADLPESRHYWTQTRGSADISGPQWRPVEGAASNWQDWRFGACSEWAVATRIPYCGTGLCLCRMVE